MGTYAKDTTVSSTVSRLEIERTLQRYGATSFAYGWQQGRAMIAFEIADRRVRFLLPLPDAEASEFIRTPVRRQLRSKEKQQEAYEQAVRQRWRALALVIKAKLEAIEAGISTIEEEFLAHTVLPSGATVGQWLLPQIAASYQTGNMPRLLPGLTDDED